MKTNDTIMPSDRPAIDVEGLPRERLEKVGAAALTDSELLAVILSGGSDEQKALEQARLLLDSFSILQRMGNATVSEIQYVSGIRKEQAIAIKAAFELGKRMAEYKRHPGTCIQSAKDVADMLMPEFRTYETERLICLEMSTKNEVLARHDISMGGLDGTSAHPRDIFCTLVRNRASAMIIVHNHPSGNAQPSQADIQISQKLCKGAELLGIRFLDHIIIGDGSFVSLKDQGLLKG
ncbi:MAG TPA: DNA repair protein RadC [Candidatus Hydrogenedentes bacterium]|jgi:DNA repair protein RadC|nr:DNA repair protein RadC [Candidatus Hydrogenedentota bacterium]